jgi:long-chain fatty acid transport protein
VHMRHLLILPFIMLSLLASAGGFQVALQGQKQAGMAHTGVAIPQDASTLYFNPGALSFTKYSQISGNIWLVFPKIRFMEEGSNYLSGMKDHIATPFSFYASGSLKSTDKWKVGIGVYTPYGAQVEYPEAWPGRFVVQKTTLRTIYIQPTFSYKIGNKLGIGAGLIYSRGNVLLSRAIPLTDSLGNTATAELTGKGGSFSFNAGVYYEISKQFSIGANYKHGTTYKADDGNVDFTVPSALHDSFPDGRLSTTLRIPWEIDFGLSYRPMEKVTLAFDVNYVGWNVYDTIALDFEKNTSVAEDMYLPRNFKNSFTFRLGGQYDISKVLSIRGGTYIDLTPVQDGFVPPETPDADRFVLTAGATINAGHLELNATLLYGQGLERVEKRSENYAALGGIYKGQAFILGIGMSYNFYKEKKADVPQ